MKNNLAENIRNFRKERGLTQEQLAEVFDMTVGAVHKWEAGLSTPDISILMELADFFDTSLDVLAGYNVRDNRIDVLCKRLRKMTDTMDPNGPAEADKALKKYPNSFKVVYECACLYTAFSSMFKTTMEYAIRARDLYEQSLRLISQNTDPNIDETALYGRLAQVYLIMEDYDKGLEIYKAHNAGYIYNSQIGQLLLYKGDYEEAEINLSYALVGEITHWVNLIINKALCYIRTDNLGEAKAILEMGLNMNDMFKKDDKPSYLDRISCMYLAGLAYIFLKQKRKKEAADTLKKAKAKAEAFDAAPEYDARKERFVEIKETCMAYDNTGETCIEVIGNSIELLKSPELSKLWKSIN